MGRRRLGSFSGLSVGLLLVLEFDPSVFQGLTLRWEALLVLLLVLRVKAEYLYNVKQARLKVNH